VPGADCRAEDAALLATGRDQPKAGARPGDGQSLKRPAALSALPLNWPAAEPRAGLDTTPGGWLAGVDDDKAARDLIEALHDLLDGLDAGEFDDLEWVRLAQISDLTRTGTQSGGHRAAGRPHRRPAPGTALPDQVSHNHRLGRVQWVRMLSEVEEDALDFG